MDLDSASIGMLAALIILVAFSAYFSATETAFTSLNRIRLKARADDGNLRAARTLKLAEDYDKLLSTILIGNNVVNITATTVATVLCTRWFHQYGPTVSTVALTVIILIFGEISPKSLAKENAERWALFATPLLRILMVLFTPANFLFGQWKLLLGRLFRKKDDEGITEEELLTQLKPDIERMAEANDETYEEACLHLKRQYDGYHFSKACADIYNPFSLFNAFNSKEYKNYWFSTGTPTFLIDILRHADFDVRALEGVEATDEQFDAPTEQITSPIPVLYQSGYLTIKGYDRNFQIYRLAYPNGEVRKGFIESLLPSYVHLPAQNNTFYVVSFLRDLMKGDVESCLERTRSFFASIPNDLENKTEKHYQTIFYLLFRLMGQYVESEVKSSVGRADVVVQLQDVVYVFEFKYDGTPEEALAQIDSKQYAIPYRADGRRVVKIGVNFDSATRTIGGWKIAKAD